ncbi:MAG: GNAT family N-acetyltransferase [Chloroflexi bacterium]|nr:GNAT family N-acetyltransferase [Chloroflexota bacterium]
MNLGVTNGFKMDIRKAGKEDIDALLGMALSLWPDEPRDYLRKSLKNILASRRQAVFVCKSEDGKYAGFINVSTRREYVPGATSYPVGYVEGIYVRPKYRRKGIARKLMGLGERWAADKGCEQIGSDTWLWNTASQKFHKRVGFKEEERVVFYIKRLEVSQS